MKTKICPEINSGIKNKSKWSNFLIKLGLTLGLVIAVFLLWGLTSKVEAATAEFKVNSYATGMDNDQKNPTIGVDSSNRFYVAWASKTFTVFDVFGRIYDSSGSSLTDDDEALDVTNLDEDCYNPSLTVNDNGYALLAWRDDFFAGSSKINAQGRLFKYGGSGDNLGTAQKGPVGDADRDFRINDDISNYTCDTPSITTDGTDFAIGYYDKNTSDTKQEGDDGTRIKLAFLNGTAFPKDKKAAIAGDYQTDYTTKETRVVANTSGYGGWSKAVAWEADDGITGNEIHVQLYTTSGSKKGSEQVFTGNKFDDTDIEFDMAVNNQGYLTIAANSWDDKAIQCIAYKEKSKGWGWLTLNDSIVSVTGDVVSDPRVFTSGSGTYITYNLTWIGGGTLKYPILKYIKVDLSGSTPQTSDSGNLIDSREGTFDGELAGWETLSNVDYSILVLPKKDDETLRIGIQWTRSHQQHPDDKFIRGAQFKFYSSDPMETTGPKTLVSRSSGKDYTNSQAEKVSPSKYCLFYNEGPTQSGDKTVKAKFFSDNTFASGVASISLPTSDTISFTGNHYRIAADGNGAIGAIFQKDAKVYAKRYDANLKELGGSTRVDEESSANANYPDICALSDGDFNTSFRSKYQGSSEYQAQQVPIKAFSSSLTSSTFSPTESESAPVSLLDGLIQKADAASGVITINSGEVEWTEITWAESGIGDESSVIVQVSTDKGGNWLAVENGNRISDKIRTSGTDMPAISKTIKYKIIASSTGSSEKPQVDWIQIGYGPAITDYDYFMRVSPAQANVVVNTTKEVTVKVTRKEAEGEEAEQISFIPKAEAAAIELEDTEEAVADQEVSVSFKSGTHGKLKNITAEQLGTPDSEEGEESELEGESGGSVRGESTGLESGDSGTSIGTGGITGRTNDDGEFKFYYEAPSEYNLEDVIKVATVPAGESTITADITMNTVYPVNTVFTSDPAFVGHDKEVTFTGAITNHITESVDNIAAEVDLNDALTYVPDSAKINGREENVRVIMENSTLRFECLGTEGESKQSELEGGGGSSGGEAQGGSVRGKQIAVGGFEIQEGGGILAPDETLSLEFKATAKVIEGEGEGLESSSNLYKAGLSLSYQEVISGKEYQNGKVTAQGTVASIWLQTLFGDIYAQGGFSADVMPPGGSGNATYLVQADGTISHYSSQSGSHYEIQNYVQGILSPVNVKRLMRDQVDQVLADKERFKVRELTAGLHKVSDLDKGQKETIYIDGNLILETDQDFKSPLTVVVTGDLRIKDSTSYDNTPVDNIKKLPSLGLIVLGDTVIEKEVTHGVGAIYSEGSISTGESNDQLVWEGLWVASGFNLDRTHFHTGDVSEPAEKVIYDGRVVANPPTGFAELTDFPVWTEVAPK
ncbi:hypothetical protein ACFLZS_01420 [Patescibacteria group bacterium]